MSEAGQWDRVLDALRLQMTKATFDTWLNGSRLIESQGENGSTTWVVGVRSAYALDWLNGRLGGLVAQTAERIGGQGVRVRFVVHDPAGAEAQPSEEPEPPEQILEAVREERLSIDGKGRWGGSTDYYIKFKVAFRRRALRELKGAKLSVFLCLALHVDYDGIAYPGIEQIMKETGYSRAPVCAALEGLVSLGLITKTRSPQRGTDEYQVNGYAWFGRQPAPALLEVGGP